MKKTLRVVAVLLSLALLLCCAAASAEAATPEFPEWNEEITLTLWTWAPGTAEMVAAFEEAYPNIHVETPMVGSGNDMYTKLQTVMASGSGGPDVVQIEFQSLLQFVDAGYLLDISEYGAQYEEYVVPWIWNQCTCYGKLYAIPQDAGPLGLFYAPELLAQCGIDTYPETYDELKEACAIVREKMPESYLINYPVSDTSVVMGLLWQAGWRPFHYDEAADAWEISINTEEAKNVLNFWGDMINEDLVSVVFDWTPEWGTALNDGTFLSFVGAAWSPVSQILPYKTDKCPTYNVTTLPQWDAENPSNGNWGGSSYAVSAHTKNAEAATMLAAWINLSDFALKFDVQSGGRGLFPACPAGYELEEFHSPDAVLSGQETADIWVEAMSTVDVSFEWSPWNGYFTDELANECIAAYEGKQTWDDALDNLQNKMIAYAESMDYEVVF